MLGILGGLVRRHLVLLVVALALGSGLTFTAAAAGNGTAVPGNNGTLKIHEQGTPDHTVNNDPKVCVFNVESFFLDAGQTGYLVFTVQGGDQPTGTPAGPFDFGPADAEGYYATQYFNLDPGHYKATLYGKQLPNGTLTDVKAKSKVFKVICAGPEPSPSVLPTGSASPSPSPEPSLSPSPSPSPSLSPSPSVGPSSSVGPSRSPSPGPVSPSPNPTTTP